ncbi:MAG: hypothetical protein ACJ8FY_02100 [Gemmataceae bacterium]
MTRIVVDIRPQQPLLVEIDLNRKFMAGSPSGWRIPVETAGRTIRI